MEVVGRWRDTGDTECMFWTRSNRQSTHYAMTHRPTKSLSPCRVCPSVCLKLCLCLFAGLYPSCVCRLIRPSVRSPKPPRLWKFTPRSLSLSYPSDFNYGFGFQQRKKKRKDQDNKSLKTIEACGESKMHVQPVSFFLPFTTSRRVASLIYTQT